MKFENDLFVGNIGKIDKNKKSILTIDFNDDDTFSISDYPFKIIRDKLKREYNVITFYLKRIKNLKRKRECEEGEDNNIYNLELFKKEVFELIDKLPNFEAVFSVGVSGIVLPPTSYIPKTKSEELHSNLSGYYDYIENNKEILDIINETNEKIFSTDYSTIRKLSPYAIVSRNLGFYTIFLKLLWDNKKFKKFFTYVLDPETAIRPFLYVNKIPHKLFYYANDKRGTRDFEKSNAAIIQQYAKIKYISDDFIDDEILDIKEKTKNLIFIGTVLHDKKSRRDIWDEFLKDFYYKDSEFYIPIKRNGIPSPKKDDNLTKKNFLKNTKDQELLRIYNEIVNHKLYKGYLKPESAISKIQEFKFGLVFRCVSIYESLTNKPFEYIYNDVLPLIDYKYDPEGLQIPKHLKEKVQVKDAKDIENLIEKYQDENLRQEVLNEFKEHFGFTKDFNFEKKFKKM